MKFQFKKRNAIIGSIGFTAAIIIHLSLFSNTVFFFNSEIQDFGKPENTIIVKPYLTANAYIKGGFYDYYKGTCDEECLSVKLEEPTYRFEASMNGIKVFEALKYNFIDDYQIHSDPKILEKYDKVILLHSEYVTDEMFKAITKHQNVVYLYPNALYGKVEINDGVMTLIRGHNYENGKYPTEVKNGFDWEFDNTHPYEYDRKCENWMFTKITNGWQLNCYPESLVLKDKNFLREVYKITTKPIKCINNEIVTYPDKCKGDFPFNNPSS